ncbi:MAG: DUF433 domain-containing protein [Acidobacteria bacterium]|nr:DUF433 domain-containing protein [Acidobacteriota bacterium]
MQGEERITSDPEILSGKPIIRGTRLAVEFILEQLAAGATDAELIEDYPHLTREDILACLAYAAWIVKEFRPVPRTA